MILPAFPVIPNSPGVPFPSAPHKSSDVRILRKFIHFLVLKLAVASYAFQSCISTCECFCKHLIRNHSEDGCRQCAPSGSRGDFSLEAATGTSRPSAGLFARDAFRGVLCWCSFPIHGGADEGTNRVHSRNHKAARIRSIYSCKRIECATAPRP